ncbi:MAG: hypothetical protein KKC25_00085 [Proteobacteria bacterium]|nr:hypothetical protein [Pseudomonadota bacterium]MBU2262744.1 hypothetical protein [Pseudomonadota bacterium]
MDLQTEVLIIGGGATGAGIARDLSLKTGQFYLLLTVILVGKGNSWA